MENRITNDVIQTIEIMILTKGEKPFELPKSFEDVTKRHTKTGDYERFETSDRDLINYLKSKGFTES